MEGEALEASAPLAGGAPLGVRGALRLVRAFASTGRAMASLAWGASPGDILSVWSASVLSALRISVKVDGRIPDGARLWVANHLSWLDPLVLLSLRPMGVLAKREVAGYPLLGRAAARAGLRFVEREDALSRAAALVGLIHELRMGSDFLVFPEGTTTRSSAAG